MTPQKAKKMLKAKLECLKNETSGINYACNMRLCDGCSLNYEQGNMGEQKEALDMAIKALEQQPKTGHWIVIREEHEFMGGIVNEPRGCKCSNCNKVVRFKSDFCTNCGAKMAESEE